MKIIFLDFDGVLLTADSYMQKGTVSACCGLPPSEESVKQLNLLAEETDASIVVSSAWRLGQDREDLEMLLREWGVTAPVIDRTPYFPAEIRGVEIQHWLAKMAEEHVDGFVILDDDADMGPLKPWLVQTNFVEGFNAEDKAEAVRVINGTEMPDLTCSEAAWESIREAMQY